MLLSEHFLTLGEAPRDVSTHFLQLSRLKVKPLCCFAHVALSDKLLEVGTQVILSLAKISCRSLFFSALTGLQKLLERDWSGGEREIATFLCDAMAMYETDIKMDVWSSRETIEFSSGSNLVPYTSVI